MNTIYIWSTIDKLQIVNDYFHPVTLRIRGKLGSQFVVERGLSSICFCNPDINHIIHASPETRIRLSLHNEPLLKLQEVSRIRNIQTIRIARRDEQIADPSRFFFRDTLIRNVWFSYETHEIGYVLLYDMYTCTCNR